MDDRGWLKGYVSEARYLRAIATFANTYHASAIYAQDGHLEGVKDVKAERPVKGWSHGKSLVKTTLRHWARAYVFTMGEDQRGMVDALLDSVGC